MPHIAQNTEHKKTSHKGFVELSSCEDDIFRKFAIWWDMYPSIEKVFIEQEMDNLTIKLARKITFS